MAQTQYLTPAEVVSRWNGRITVKTLANWRSLPEKPGPAFSRFGNRILYPIDQIEAFEKSRTYDSTQSYGKQPERLAS